MAMHPVAEPQQRDGDEGERERMNGVYTHTYLYANRHARIMEDKWKHIVYVTNMTKQDGICCKHARIKELRGVEEEHRGSVVRSRQLDSLKTHL